MLLSILVYVHHFCVSVQARAAQMVIACRLHTHTHTHTNTHTHTAVSSVIRDGASLRHWKATLWGGEGKGRWRGGGGWRGKNLSTGSCRIVTARVESAPGVSSDVPAWPFAKTFAELLLTAILIPPAPLSASVQGPETHSTLLAVTCLSTSTYLIRIQV